MGNEGEETRWGKRERGSKERKQKRMHESKTTYHEERGVAGAAIGVFLICILVGIRGGSVVFRLGPCDAVEECPSILGVEARSWSVWAFLSLILIVKEGLLAYGNTTYRFWIANEVMDRKAIGPIRHSTPRVVAMVTTWKAFQYLTSVVDVNVAMSLDVQFLVMLFCTETIVYIATTIHALRQRRRRTQPLLWEAEKESEKFGS